MENGYKGYVGFSNWMPALKRKKNFVKAKKIYCNIIEYSFNLYFKAETFGYVVNLKNVENNLWKGNWQTILSP